MHQEKATSFTKYDRDAIGTYSLRFPGGVMTAAEIPGFPGDSAHMLIAGMVLHMLIAVELLGLTRTGLMQKFGSCPLLTRILDEQEHI